MGNSSNWIWDLDHASPGFRRPNPRFGCPNLEFDMDIQILDLHVQILGLIAPILDLHVQTQDLDIQIPDFTQGPAEVRNFISQYWTQLRSLKKFEYTRLCNNPSAVIDNPSRRMISISAPFLEADMVGYIVPYMEPPISPSTIMDSTTVGRAPKAPAPLLWRRPEAASIYSGWWGGKHGHIQTATQSDN